MELFHGDLELSIYEMLNIQTYLCSCQGLLTTLHQPYSQTEPEVPASFQWLKC